MTKSRFRTILYHSEQKSHPLFRNYLLSLQKQSTNLKKQMKQFMDENFLLQTETAQKLYHEHAAKMPIIDYHCHLVPQQVAENKRFRSITEVWLGGDHYKWRAMRSNGVPEKYCTGKDTSDWEKFEKWAETVPYTFRNPLYHWTHLELKTAFGINKRLNPETAREIFDECNDKLANDPSLTPWGLLNKYNVETVCTTDDPIDDLHYHSIVAKSELKTRMLPAWRPDKAMAPENAQNFREYVEKLSAASGKNISKEFISTLLDGMDALLSTVQMPSGIPVATVAIGGGANAALLAAEILAVEDAALAERLAKKRESDREAVLCKDAGIAERL